MDLDFFEARVYGAVLDLMQRTKRNGANFDLQTVDHYKIMRLISAGVELRDFEDALEMTNLNGEIKPNHVFMFALTTASARQEVEGI